MIATEERNWEEGQGILAYSEPSTSSVQPYEGITLIIPLQRSEQGWHRTS